MQDAADSLLPLLLPAAPLGQCLVRPWAAAGSLRPAAAAGGTHSAAAAPAFAPVAHVESSVASPLPATHQHDLAAVAADLAALATTAAAAAARVATGAADFAAEVPFAVQVVMYMALVQASVVLVAVAAQACPHPSKQGVGLCCLL